jgi:outer membrane lipoprotein-sorting protein
MLFCAALPALSSCAAQGAAPVTAGPSGRTAAAAAQDEPAVKAAASSKEFRDDPEARALYNLMFKTMRDADSLSWRATVRTGTGDKLATAPSKTYSIWLKKPNYARLEAFVNGRLKGVLIGDGEYFYIYWPDGRHQRKEEMEGAAKEEYERARLISYVKKPTPVGGHSIAHDSTELGLGMITVEPSSFHGAVDSLQGYIDCIETVGTESVLGEECNVIRVSFMRGQREYTLWLSKTDHQPRRTREVVHVSVDYLREEVRTRVAVNDPVSEDKFSWKPPSDWVLYREPPLEKSLLAKGVDAPDFELASIGGGKIRLSDYRGQVVWMYVWRAG